jgi:hypothetical protein
MRGQHLIHQGLKWTFWSCPGIEIERNKAGGTVAIRLSTSIEALACASWSKDCLFTSNPNFFSTKHEILDKDNWPIIVCLWVRSCRCYSQSRFINTGAYRGYCSEHDASNVTASQRPVRYVKTRVLSRSQQDCSNHMGSECCWSQSHSAPIFEL